MTSTRTASGPTVSTATVTQARSTTWLWPGLLVAVGGSISLFYTCTVPLVGFAVVAAATTSRNRALLVCGLVWLANQVWGYTLHGYPHTFSTFAWGLVMGAGTLAATALASLGAKRLPSGHTARLLGTAAFLLVGFVVYEAFIGLAALGLGGLEAFTPAVLWGVFVTNAAWSVALLLAHALLLKLRDSSLPGG